MEIREFDGDWGALRRLGEASEAGTTGPDRFAPDLLRALLGGAPRGLLLGAYAGAELVGFLASAPRASLVSGHAVPGALCRLLAVRPDHRRRGVARSLAGEAARRLAEAGVRIALFHHELDGPAAAFVASLRSGGAPIVTVKDLQGRGRLLSGEAAAGSEPLAPRHARRALRPAAGRIGQIGAIPGVLREYDPPDLPRALALINAEEARADLGRLWTEEALAPRLDAKGVGHAVVYERAGAAAGVIAYTVCLHRGRAPARWAWLDHVVLPAMNPWERSGLLKRFLHHAREQGCAGVIEWSRGYYPARRLWLDRFFRLERRLRLSAWRFDRALPVSDLKSVYEEIL